MLKNIESCPDKLPSECRTIKGPMQSALYPSAEGRALHEILVHLSVKTGDFSHLSKIAKRFLLQPAAAGQCEDGWYELDFFQVRATYFTYLTSSVLSSRGDFCANSHTPRRNRLAVESLDKHVFLKNNLMTATLKDDLISCIECPEVFVLGTTTRSLPCIAPFICPQ